MQDDRRLIERLRAGDESAFRAFFGEFFPRVYRFAMARTRGDPQQAEEAAQRTLVRAVRGLEKFRGDAALFSWLAQICRNELADLGASARRHERHLVSLDAQGIERDRAHAVPDDSPSAEQALRLRDRSLLIREVLDSLPGRYGQVLEWKYLEELGVEALAERLGTTFEAAQSQLQRARMAFRAALEARGDDPQSLLDDP
jgi:RNA polymerase sigma-70 factor (ECF subfamily)